MSNNSNNRKTDFIRLISAIANDVSSDKEKARQFLTEQGLNTTSMLSDGMKRINQMKMQIQAEKTKAEMQAANGLEEKARELVNKLLSSVDFSLPQLIKEENLTMSFRNVEQLSQEDVRGLLIKHFTLKFLAEQNDSEK